MIYSCINLHQRIALLLNSPLRRSVVFAVGTISYIPTLQPTFVASSLPPPAKPAIAMAGNMADDAAGRGPRMATGVPDDERDASP
jgi:hypothetical protein